MLLSQNYVWILVDLFLIGLLVALWWKVGRTKNKAKYHAKSTSIPDIAIGTDMPAVSEDSSYGGGSGAGAGSTRSFATKPVNMAVSADLANQGAAAIAGEAMSGQLNDGGAVFLDTIGEGTADVTTGILAETGEVTGEAVSTIAEGAAESVGEIISGILNSGN